MAFVISGENIMEIDCGELCFVIKIPCESSYIFEYNISSGMMKMKGHFYTAHIGM